MEYKRFVHTVVETLAYQKSSESLFSEVERQEIITLLAVNPEVGDLIPGTGGVRKIRVGRDGMGKRGGARVIYIVRNEGFPVFLLAAFAKNDKSDLSQAERNQLRKRVDDMFSTYGR